MLWLALRVKRLIDLRHDFLREFFLVCCRGQVICMFAGKQGQQAATDARHLQFDFLHLGLIGDLQRDVGLQILITALKVDGERFKWKKNRRLLRFNMGFLGGMFTLG